MRVNPVEKAESFANQLKGVAYVLYDQLKEARLLEKSPIGWEVFNFDVYWYVISPWYEGIKGATFHKPSSTKYEYE